MSARSSIFSVIFHEIRVVARYLRWRFFRRHGRGVSPAGEVEMPQEPAEEPAVVAQEPEAEQEKVQENPVPREEAAPAPEASLSPQEAPAEPPPTPSQEKIAAKLMDAFGAKFNAREERKRQAISQLSRRNRKQQEEDDRQLLFNFGPEEPPKEEKKPIPSIYDRMPDGYQLPDPAIFKLGDGAAHEDPEEIREVARKIQDCLDSFSVDAEVCGAVRGPRITMHKINVAQGVRVGIISGYEKDLTMALAAESLRIIAPVPGHDYVGIEVPNKTSDAVLLGDLVAGKGWTESRALLPLALGKNVDGRDVILDLTKAPHLIVAGATGSGKSVCLNTFIVSLVTRFAPSDLRLLLVDPKMVEMNMYNTLPHLITPVINDVNHVVLALRWLVYEMTQRYKMLSKAGVRNLEDYNKRPTGGEPVLDDDGNPLPEKMPFIVLIIDELADIMLTNRQDVENSLARLAQMSRAVGIHTIIATQRPSVDVLTGVIKANFPTRIAFKTSSQVDSRTILDGKGAESLLGKGDMLFRPPTAAGMQRIQGAMVTDDEIRELVDFCAAQQEAPTSFDIINTMAQNENQGAAAEVDTEVSGDDDEELVRAATEIVVREQKASISYIQRRLKIGYNKAATIMEMLEQRGVVGPQVGSMKREILMTEDSL